MSDGPSRKWYVIQTKPRWEKKVLAQIESKKIITFLPLITTIKKWSDRKKKIEVPLFNSYIFVKATAEERVEAIKETAGARKYVMYNGKPAIVSDNEIEYIRMSLTEPERIKIESKIMFEGDYVEVTEGPFTGMKGIITELRGNYKLTVNLYELSMSLNVILNPNEINKTEKPNEEKFYFKTKNYQ